MITVANRTETAARVKHAFDTGRVHVDTVESFPIRRRASRKIGLCSGAACFWWRGNRSGTIESTTGQRVSGPGTAAIQPVQGPRSGTGMDR